MDQKQAVKKTKLKSKLGAFFERRAVRGVLGVLLLVLAYVFASWAVDSGSLIDYAITLLLLYVGVRESIAALRWKRKDGRR